MRLALFLMFALAAVATGQAQESAEEGEKLSPDQQAIVKNAEAFVAAFDKGNAKAVAALWADNGEMSVDGETIAGAS